MFAIALKIKKSTINSILTFLFFHCHNAFLSGHLITYLDSLIVKFIKKYNIIDQLLTSFFFFLLLEKYS